MSKKMKVLVAVLAAILLLSVGGTAMVMAQEEEPTPTPEAGANGLLARVADILGISQEELGNAFRQAQQEMRQDTFLRFLDKAVEQGRITQEEGDEFLEWWEQRPETCDRLLLRARICQGTHSRQMQQQGLGLMLGSQMLERQREHREWRQTGPPWLAE